MNAALLPLVVAVPLIAAALAAVLPSRAARSGILIVTNVAALGFGVLLVAQTWDGAVLATNVGLWPNGIAIPFAADVFSGLMIVVTALLSIVCSWFGIAAGDDDRRYFAPLVLVLSAGVYGALSTGDLFNLFVFIEVMLLPSYALIAIYGGTKRIAAGRLYVTTNLLTSTIFLLGVGLVYGVAGTVNIAELAGAASDSPMVAAAGAVVLIALSVKAAVVPVHGWLTQTYPNTSPAVRALFSGLHTKVAIYAIYRIYAVVFDGEQRYLWIALLVTCATMLIGVFGAVGENDARSILTFHMISQIGYILLGVALFGPIGVAAGIFYLLHHMIVKASLFLSAGAVQTTYGTDSLGRVTGLAKREPLLAAAFFGAALSLGGLPPFSGFVAKLTLVQAAVTERQYVAAAVTVVVSLLTLMSMLKIWKGMFMCNFSAPAPARTGWLPAAGVTTDEAVRTRIPVKLVLPAMVLTVVTLAVGVGAQGLMVLAQQAADGLVDPRPYIEAVLG
ncbi:monovalent cation/H+ antiporter subunit D family protein [Rhodococcus rhodnii]|uniref:Monovalent cation/H+ antiporter subunit D family protein n=2 Tax=Rhodococcus rhodnii TaxID=38312 RepID=A0A6P2CH90_9NOCA|nr:monovalent cation/H+ antiporter subunit D family protein [Rhodococcus rhodnii]EOM76525.1 putative monovalent cation [Rhodococcus rhodnii LMG 5362]TXG92144.1 monovalent cation/H+ antiporter subunit D family protein [Rhodococcus rhodnii]